MKDIKLRKVVGTSVLSLGLVVGLAGFAGASSGTIDTTGPDSHNEIEHEWTSKVEVDNDNDVDLTNKNDQYASSGEAEVEDNTTGGDARTGNAANNNSLSGTVVIDNSAGVDGLGGSGGGSNSGRIENTGPDSHNEVEFDYYSSVEIDNENDVDIYNDNDQTAKSGDAEVDGNTTGGDAVSGSATNTNSTSFTVRITN